MCLLSGFGKSSDSREAVFTGYGMAYDVSYDKNDMVDKVRVLKWKNRWFKTSTMPFLCPFPAYDHFLELASLNYKPRPCPVG
jgi:hypothetical protein